MKNQKDPKEFITDDAPINNGRFNDEKRLYIIPLYPDDEEIYEEDDLDLENDWEEV